MSALRIGLLLESFQVPNWQHIIIEAILKHPQLKVVAVVTNATPWKKTSSGKAMYRLLRLIDRRVFSLPHDIFHIRDLTTLLSSEPHRAVRPIQTRYKDELVAADLEWLTSHEPDILIRFGFRILTGAVLTLPRYGVWSLHHGDSAVNRGGPPAFWEVVNGDAVTGVTLQVLSEKLDAGSVLGKAFCNTDRTSFGRNQVRVFGAGIELFLSRLNDLVVQGPEDFFRKQQKETSDETFAPTLFRDPNNGRALQIFFAFWLRRMRELIRGFFWEEQWALYVNRKENTVDLSGSDMLLPPNNTDWADPFLFFHQSQPHLFFESLSKKKNKGVIQMLPLNGAQKPITILDEPHHLSYPTLVMHQEKSYLLVESAASKGIGVYEPINFPTQWKKVKDLLPGKEIYDPTVFFHEGRWYLFCTQRPQPFHSPHQYLHLYVTDDWLKGEWKAHPRNPLTRDVRGARPAGPLFYEKGKLLRPSQLGSPRYGYGVRLQEIKILSPEQYEEVPHQDVLPWKKSMLGTHTFQAMNGMVVSDGQSRRFRYF